MMPQPQTPPAHVGILQIMNGVLVAGAVSCLARLGIPDLVEAAPQSAQELASQIGADPQALYRLMRATASVGVLSERPDGKFSHLSTIDSPAVAEAYYFEGIHSIVDIAGGHGLLLATILQRNPHLQGTLYEMPHVLEGARSGPLKPMMERCTLASGNMFSSVPAGADAYIMKHIIHDWPDDRCIQLLKACRTGVNSGGKLLVVDSVIQPGNDFSPCKFLDLQMLIFPSGCERTEKQFRDLFAAAGWRLSRIIPTAAPDSIVEGVPA